MSKIPYVIQEDSPNLVIVPTDSCYEPSPKKAKANNTSSSVTPTKVPEIVRASEKSALVKNAGVKVKPRVSSVNNNVLIDVSKVKRQPNSWATNFLQSIGESASKLPRAYNWQSTVSKLAFPRNEIQPINYKPIVYPIMYTNTTQPNANTNSIQPKSIKEPTPVKTNTIVSQPKPKKCFSLPHEPNTITQSKRKCFTLKLKETHQPMDIARPRHLPTVSKESSQVKASKEATKLKTKKETTQLKPASELAYLKAKKELALIIARKKINHTKAILQTKVHKEATKPQGISETSRTKVHNKATEPKVHKEKLKETATKKSSKKQTAEVNRENIALKKIKVDGKKTTKSSSKKNEKPKERESSKSRQSTSPLKSVVVKRVKKYTLDDSPQYSHKYKQNRNLQNFEKIRNKDCDVDLRAKLKRKAPKNETYLKEYEGRDKRKQNTIFPTSPNGKGFVPNDNLIISFENEHDPESATENIKPVKAKNRKHQSGGSKCKKIKLEINIVIKKQSDISDDESSKREDKEEHEIFPDNNDLSFLDDFNVDEIAESLNDCQNSIKETVNNLTTNEQKLNDISMSKCEIDIENNNTISSVLCDIKSSLKTEKKPTELIMEVESHNGVTENSNDNSQLKITNILKPQKEFQTVKTEEGTDKSSNAIEEIKTEFILHDANTVKEESSKDIKITNSQNTEKLSESIIPAELKLKQQNIETPTAIKSNGVNSLQNKNIDIAKTTNISSKKYAKNLTAVENGTLQNVKENKSKTKDKVKTVEPLKIAENSKHKDDVILIEDSDNECDEAETKGTQHVVEKKLIDLTNQKDGCLDTQRKEDNPVDAVKPKLVETDSEPILILDTDYDELKAIVDSKNKESITNSKKCPEPIDIIKKHLLLHSNNMPHASDTIKEKPGTSTLLDHKKNTEKKNNPDKVTLVANKDKVTDNIALVNTKPCEKSGQDQAKSNAGDQKEKLISPTNDNDDVNITMWLESKISQDIEEEENAGGKKNSKLNGKEKPITTGNQIATAKENHDGEIRMWVVNKGDTRTNAVTQNQPETNSQDTKDGPPKPVVDMNTQNETAKCQPKEPNKTVEASTIENKTAPAKEKEDDKPKTLAKGDPRNKPNQTKTNSPGAKDGKPKPINNVNPQNVNVKCQPKALNKHTPPVNRNNSSELVQVDAVAQRLESRMRVYFGAKILITELIHSGQFSTIYCFKDGRGVSKTVKQIKSSWQMGASKEAMMMKLQNGVPEVNYNCVRHYRGFSEAGLWCYVMEYYPKNLQEVMSVNNRSFHINQVQEFSRQLVAAVTILRNNNIIHSDINPLHILVNDSETRLKLCGFDQAFYYNGGYLLPNVGTVNYRAPELILGFQADYSIDVWATALVMYEMATNRQLFPGFFNNDILYKQFCTINSFPYDMLGKCYYRNHHFMGDAFVRIVGSRGEGKVLVHNFIKKERIYNVLLQVHQAEWAKFGANKAQEKDKIIALGTLLNKMLVMDPRYRIAIEFVFADPFIYEMF